MMFLWLTTGLRGWNPCFWFATGASTDKCFSDLCPIRAKLDVYLKRDCELCCRFHFFPDASFKIAALLRRYFKDQFVMDL
jgi:hypothetical protein